MADDQGKQPHDRFFLEHLDQVDIVNEHGEHERGDRYIARKKRDAAGGPGSDLTGAVAGPSL